MKYEPNSKAYKEESKRLVAELLAEHPDSSRYYLEQLVHCYLTDPESYEKIISDHLEENNVCKNIDEQSGPVSEGDAVQSGSVPTQG